MPARHGNNVIIPVQDHYHYPSALNCSQEWKLDVLHPHFQNEPPSHLRLLRLESKLKNILHSVYHDHAADHADRPSAYSFDDDQVGHEDTHHQKLIKPNYMLNYNASER